MSVRADLELLNGIAFVDSWSFDDSILSLTIKGVTYTVLIPEEYPAGEPALLGERSEVLRAGNLVWIATQVQRLHEADAATRGSGDDVGSVSSEYYEASPSMSREGTTTLDSGLSADIECFKKHFGLSSVSLRQFELAEWVTISIPIENVITETVASAWGVKRTAPIVCELKFETKQYIDQSKPPKVQLTQGGSKFPLGQQMTRALARYLEQSWKHGWSPRHVAEEGTPGAATQSRSGATGAGGHPAASAGSGAKATASTASAPRLTSAQQEIYDALVGMDFELDFARSAALHCTTVEEALDFDPSTVGTATIAAVGAVDSVTAAEVFANPSLTRYDESADPAKVVPFVTRDGFLVYIAHWLWKRIPTSSKFCVICDQPHLFGATNMIRAAVCTRDICVFAYHELSIGSDAAESVATDAGVIDLLVCVFRNAALSSRKEFVLKPFPKVPHPERRDVLALDPDKPDFRVLQEALKAFPTVEQLVKSRDLVSLRDQMTARNALAYPLLEWVISSNRSHIVKMQEGHLIKSMQTKHQFLLMTAPPEKEEVFNRLKKKHGSKLAWHGSRAENWHAILRNGLKNMSGTQGQLNGAAHGNGVYFAPVASSSFGYCSASGSGNKSTTTGYISESEMICIALCEIVDLNIKDHGWCWTVEDESHIITRFFFVYDNMAAQGSAGNATTTDKAFREEVAVALKFYGIN